MTGRCETCRHWERDDIAIFGERHICLLTLNDHEYDGADKSLANVFDDEYGHAGLWTDGKFGCIQYEPMKEGAE